jgi:3-methyladenine DNA glycosylase/8-oxoguanine DNA glycosylase
LRLRVAGPPPRALLKLANDARRFFDLHADPHRIAAVLKRDSRLRAEPGVRVPGCWNAFELLVRTILGQQVTVAGASTLMARLVESVGERFEGTPGLSHLFPAPSRLADADLTRLGLPRRRAKTISEVARLVATDQLDLDSPGPDTVARIAQVVGIGPWTVSYFAMRACGDTDALPAGDLGLRKALGVTSAREVTARAQKWRPFSAYAAMILWRSLGSYAK